MKATIIIIDEQRRDRAIDALRSLPFDVVHEVVVRPHKSNRTLAQNNLLHHWCREIALGVGESTGEFHQPEAWKEFLKQLFLGQESFMIGGTIITRTKRTRDLKVKPFAEFLGQVDHYSGSELQVFLSRPEDLYYEAMKR